MTAASRRAGQHEESEAGVAARARGRRGAQREDPEAKVASRSGPQREDQEAQDARSSAAARPLRRDETNALAAALGRLGVGRTALRSALPQFRAVELARHQFVMRAGEPVRTAGLVLSGVLREYYLLEDGTERTRAFAVAGDAYGSAADALSGRAARVFTRSETAAVLAEIPWSALLALVRSSRAWERMFHGLVQALYLRKAEREYQLLALDALARYQALRRDAPHLEQLVPQVLIASFLGITPVHLSRLRRRLRDGA